MSTAYTTAKPRSVPLLKAVASVISIYTCVGKEKKLLHLPTQDDSCNIRRIAAPNHKAKWRFHRRKSRETHVTCNTAARQCIYLEKRLRLPQPCVTLPCRGSYQDIREETGQRALRVSPRHPSAHPINQRRPPPPASAAALSTRRLNRIPRLPHEARRPAARPSPLRCCSFFMA